MNISLPLIAITPQISEVFSNPLLTIWRGYHTLSKRLFKDQKGECGHHPFQRIPNTTCPPNAPANTFCRKRALS